MESHSVQVLNGSIEALTLKVHRAIGARMKSITTTKSSPRNDNLIGYAKLSIGQKEHFRALQNIFAKIMKLPEAQSHNTGELEADEVIGPPGYSAHPSTAPTERTPSSSRGSANRAIRWRPSVA